MALWTNFDPVNTDYSNVCPSTAGIKNNFLANTLLVAHPNPAHDVINITFSLENAVNSNIGIYDLLGKQVELIDLNQTNLGLNSAGVRGSILMGFPVCAKTRSF